MFLLVLVGLPSFSLAAANEDVCTEKVDLIYMVCKVSGLLNSIIPLLVALGMVYFVYGVVTYVIRDDEEAKQRGRDKIVFGIIGLAVIFSVWGLVAVLRTTLGIEKAVSAPTAEISGLVTITASSTTCKLEKKLQGLLDYVTCIIGKSVIPFLFAIAVLSFIWGSIKFFIIDADEESKREQGRQFMLWGIIALAVMISVWGLVGILGDTFNIGTSVLPTVKP